MPNRTSSTRREVPIAPAAGDHVRAAARTPRADAADASRRGAQPEMVRRAPTPPEVSFSRGRPAMARERERFDASIVT